QINPANFRGVAVGNHERWNILHNLRAAAGDCEPPDPAKLMHGSESAHHGMISHLHMTAQGAVVRKNHVIAHGAIVPDMTVSEKISMIADPRFALGRRAAMCRY